jgi:hypothetical protein
VVLKLTTVSAEIRHVPEYHGRITAPPQRDRGGVTSLCPGRNAVEQDTLSALDRGEEFSSTIQAIGVAKDPSLLCLIYW